MIVAMKKATVITRRPEKQDALNKLRRLGVLHLSTVPAQVAPAQEWREKKMLLEKALALIAPQPAPRHEQAAAASSETCRAPSAGTCSAALATARSILENHETIRKLNDEAANLEKEMARLHDWQGVSVSDLRAIRAGDVEVMFFEVPPKKLGLIPPGHKAFVVKRSKTLLWVALVLKAGTAVDHEFKPLHVPRRGAAELEKLQAENRSDQRRLRLELDRLGNAAGDLEQAVHDAAREIELAEAAAAMGHTETLSYLTGFLPGDQVQGLRQSCRENNWALLIQEPAADDDVPTVIRNKRWIDIISPVFQLLGTVPGYREIDISFFFLVFFAFFFAVIIGDAGYGLVLLAGTLFFSWRLRRKKRKMPQCTPADDADEPEYRRLGRADRHLVRIGDPGFPALALVDDHSRHLELRPPQQ